MHEKLAQALDLLAMTKAHVYDEQGKIITTIPPEQQAKALFTYFDIAGYFSEDLLEKAITYLAVAKPFACDNNKVLPDLKLAYQLSYQTGYFNLDYFLDHFAVQSYFKVEDIIDLITFLQQTAFDRASGFERDRLSAKSWMITKHKEFIHCATQLGVVTTVPPLSDTYYAAAIMGANTIHIQKRIHFFKKLVVKSNYVLALTGDRPLTKGLDEESDIEELANYFNQPICYVKQQIGKDTREFFKSITEDMMLNYYLHKIMPYTPVHIITSLTEPGHWRTTSAQSAADVAPFIIEKIQQENDMQDLYKFLVVVEQPHVDRVVKQIQREFNLILERKELKNKFKILVEGCGQGLTSDELKNDNTLATINSELAALMAERYTDARRYLNKTNVELRNSDFIIFNKRDLAFKSQ
jgi:hypothetical protein